MAGADLFFIEFFFGFECFASLAVPALVATLVNVTVIKNFLGEGFAAFVMPGFAGLDEIIKAYIQGSPYFFKLVCHLIAISLCIEIKISGPACDLDGVFIVAHEKENIFPLHALEASLNISPNFFEGGANMRPTVGVIDCCSDKEVLARRHKEPL